MQGSTILHNMILTDHTTLSLSCSESTKTHLLDIFVVDVPVDLILTLSVTSTIIPAVIQSVNPECEISISQNFTQITLISQFQFCLAY